MEFWGVEVKAGKPLTVQSSEASSIHLSNASLGESKGSGTDSFPIFVKVGDQKLVLGRLSSKNIPQIAFDLFFEKEFELSHNWKHGTVYFCGYRGENSDGDHVNCGSDCEHESGEELDLPLNNAATGKPKASKDDASKLKLKLLEPNEDKTSSDDSDYSESDEDSDDAPDVQADFEESDDINDSEESDDEESSDEDEEMPKKVESSKKRPAESATITSVPAKKVKLATPQKTDGKKSSVHIDTPRPTKQAVKIPASSEKSKGMNSKSHSKAKHAWK